MDATMRYADAVAEVASVLEYAPANPGPVAPTLRGWWVACADGDMYLCSRCAGRMLARSFNLPRNAEPVWRDKAEPYGVCAGCESAEFVPGGCTTGRASAIFASRWFSPTPTAQGSKCEGDAYGDGYPGTRYFHKSPGCPGHD